MNELGVSLLGRLVNAWRDIAGSRNDKGVSPDLSAEGDAQTLQDQMQACLEGRGGEVTARANAARLGRTYLELDKDGRARFLRILAEKFDADSDAVDAAIETLRNAGPEDRDTAMASLRRTLDPPRKRLLTQFNELPEGVKFLVDLREDLIGCIDDSSMKALDEDLRDLLASWFDIGFLELRRITWRSPASLLEKLIAYEAVHEVRSWDDLKNRLARDRRLYGFFHPRMPDEPLIFVQVALVNGLAADVSVLLDETAPTTDPNNADTAIFYSITNAQRGLVGISFGGFLIKRVVDTLAAEFKGLKTFATLSPIPGFKRWSERELDRGTILLSQDEDAALSEALATTSGADALRKVFDDVNWVKDSQLAAAVEPVLTQLVARYLLTAKNKRGRVADPVAHFHLTNGALVERLNWMGDKSAHGLSQSAGLMVNYLYDLARIEENHEAYTGEGNVIASSTVDKLAKL
ncbi:MAG: malonyl-CoA decarboxylase [Rhodospirillaceae bacterium]|jgi:malonyl-CoA decarboxylase|nr:malonyl-CoA decarboxylase [Rhodospirillaceae bacterium]